MLAAELGPERLESLLGLLTASHTSALLSHLLLVLLLTTQSIHGGIIHTQEVLSSEK